MSSLLPSKKLRISPSSAGMLLTPEEFDAITDYDDRYRYELINGVLVVSPIPSEAESDPNDQLGFLLRYYQQFHPQGSALDQTLPERYVRNRNRRRADRVVWAGLRRVPDPQIDVPTIAVEFPSPGKRNQQRDYEEKRQEYLAAGVSEYWIIDCFRRVMTVYRRQPGQATEEIIIEQDGVYRTTLLPGFELPVAPLFSLADRWKRSGK